DHERHEEHQHEPRDQHEAEQEHDDRRKILECLHECASRPLERERDSSDVEPEVDHVAFLHDVRLAFEPQLTGLARALLAAALDVSVVRNDLGADEAALEIGMDRPGRVVRRRIVPHRPRADLLRPGRIKRLQPEQTVRRSDHTVQAGLVEAEIFQELAALRLGKLSELRLDRRRDHADLRAVRRRVLPNPLHRGGGLTRALAAAPRSARARLFCTVSRSASMSSVSIVSMSSTGSTRPATWVTSSFSKQRTRCAIASVSRMCARNWLPRPSPCDAPFTSPAISTNSTTVGTTFSGFTIAASASRRGSGTVTTPTFGSIVQKG